MSDVKIDKVTKKYSDDIFGVKDVSFTVDDGEFIVLVGPSGCGKSTTLGLISGLLRPTDGTITFGDRIVNDVKPQNRNIAMVFQDYSLYPHKTARGNMEFAIKYSTDLSDELMEEKIQKTADMLDISHLLDQKPGQLSGGQQQRVALGRAIVRDPEIFLLDEPLSNLDAKLRTKMRAELQQLQAELDVTTIYVTHDQVEAMTMGDRIVVMDKGEVQQVGTPTDLYNKPANQFVGQFIGSPSMNVVDISSEDGQAIVSNKNNMFAARDISESQGTRIGFRPEDIEIASDGSGDISGIVRVVEELGNENYIHIRLSENEIVARVEEGERPGEQTEINLRLPDERIYLFDGKGSCKKYRTAKKITPH